MKAHKAFTLIELIAVLLIIGILAASFSALKRPEDVWPNILSSFNDFIVFACQEAIVNRKIHRVVFTSSERAGAIISLFREEVDPESKNKKIYEEIKSVYLDLPLKFPKTVRFNNIYIDGKVPDEELGRGVPLYITEDGLAQDLLIHLIRKRGELEDRATLKLKPFIGKFEFFEGFQKP
ncbi:type II secretion system protein [Candidatus Babeliales bacterium]|nr:type II secretion system protein [Candidatus Babeliales bacterium]